MATPELITAAAIKIDNNIYSLPAPARHDDVRMMLKNKGIKSVTGLQGFITNTGRFVDREEAARLALASGQIKALKFQKNELFSEDLW